MPVEIMNFEYDIFPAKPTPPAEGRWHEASVARGVWAKRFYSLAAIFKCPGIRITHRKIMSPYIDMYG